MRRLLSLVLGVALLLVVDVGPAASQTVRVSTPQVSIANQGIWSEYKEVPVTVHFYLPASYASASLVHPTSGAWAFATLLPVPGTGNRTWRGHFPVYDFQAEWGTSKVSVSASPSSPHWDWQFNEGNGRLTVKASTRHFARASRAGSTVTVTGTSQYYDRNGTTWDPANPMWKPIPAGQTVHVQQHRNGVWTTVATRRADGSGRVSATIQAPSTGAFRISYPAVGVSTLWAANSGVTRS